ncbi:hypothetical protein AVEN_236012-1 [Araneus ventricosus]|uniref:Ig-like domain-containing protein n=1 Tax=Araneus ventricosus TaxID=182803 RepID=A0A4Y2MIP0_ARAVE|nr:hypothetical protein AVEN_236012-1 [Araneus ventricosus]
MEQLMVMDEWQCICIVKELLSINVIRFEACSVYFLTAFDRAILFSSDPPSVEVLPKEGLIVNETGEAVLTCSFSANPPNVTEVVWYKDGKPAKMVHPQATPSNNLKGGPPPGVPPFKPSNKLVLDGIMRAEAGSYSCHVRNAFGRGNSTNNITVDVLCKYDPSCHKTLTCNRAVLNLLVRGCV